MDADSRMFVRVVRRQRRRTPQIIDERDEVLGLFCSWDLLRDGRKLVVVYTSLFKRLRVVYRTLVADVDDHGYAVAQSLRAKVLDEL